MSEIIAAHNLHRHFPTSTGTLEVLRGLELSVNAGEMVAIMGPSGVGKSTLLHCLGLLDRPTSGDIVLQGQPTAALSDHQISEIRNRSIGFIFQFHHLLPEFDALENVVIPTRIAGLNGPRLDQRAKDLLEQFGLGERLDHQPRELSGGEQQRVAVARALIMEPQLILADEPSGNLDEHNAKALHELLSDLVHRLDVAMVVVTHNPHLATLADRRLLLAEGKLWDQ